jgi:5-methyltetrahydropteroyltriglutamate--homocysteine methyltransferase
LWIAVDSFEYFSTSGFPGSVRVFIASLPGLSGLHVTHKPLICFEDSNSSSKTHHPQVDARREANKSKPTTHSYLQLIASNYRSVTGYEVPRKFPTTVIGSYPKLPEAEEALRLRRSGRVDPGRFRELVNAAIRGVVGDYVEVGVDVISDGEQSREDMVVFFAENLRGFTLSDWVRVFDNVYFRKPVIVGRVEWVAPATLEDWLYATSVSQGRPVKAIVTGPYTIVEWSFVARRVDRAELVLEVASALRREIERLVEAGARYVQVDEPALSTRPSKEDAQLVGEALRRMLHGLDVKKIVHICYGRLERIFEYVVDYPVDQLALEFKNSNFRLLPYLKEYSYRKELGFGVVDVHVTKVESVQEVVEAVERLMKLEVIGPEKVFLNPDCGLKRLPREVAKAKLRNMVEAARRAREIW